MELGELESMTVGLGAIGLSLTGPCGTPRRKPCKNSAYNEDPQENQQGIGPTQVDRVGYRVQTALSRKGDQRQVLLKQAEKSTGSQSHQGPGRNNTHTR